MTRHAFCEPVQCSPYSRWHIRRLTDIGMKPGGGADTPALCGIAVAWDLDVPLTAHHLGHSCPKCVELYRKEKEDDAG